MYRAIARRRALNRRAPGRRASGDAGVGLPELLVTITIMGIAFTAILSGLAVSIRSGRVHTASAKANSVLIAAGEAVKAADFCDPAAAEAPCPDPVGTYQDAVDDVEMPTGWEGATVVVTDVREDVQLRKVHDVTVRVTSPDGGMTRTLQVAKTAPPVEQEPPPPIPGICQYNAHAYWYAEGWFDIGVLVTVDAPVGQPDCSTPFKARVNAGQVIALSQSQAQPSRWEGYVPTWECLFGTCSADVYENDMTYLGTILMEFPWA